MSSSEEMADRILQSLGKQVHEDLAYNLERGSIWKACESPIERAFVAAFFLYHGYKYGKPLLSDRYSLSADAPQMFIIPQFTAGPYRVDFLIGWNIGEHRHTSVVVECDGHDFHEKTKRQAARDKARDRYLSSEFAKVMRFTGSEIYADACGCAIEAESME
jgi:hypothetical protein